VRLWFLNVGGYDQDRAARYQKPLEPDHHLTLQDRLPVRPVRRRPPRRLAAGEQTAFHRRAEQPALSAPTRRR